MAMEPDLGIQSNYNRLGGIPKEEQKWYKIMLWLKEYVEDYTRGMDFKPSLRTAFYDATDAKIVKDTEYEGLQRQQLKQD